MNARRVKPYLMVLLLIVAAILAYSFMFSPPAVDFNTDIKPILNRKCISCHGGVKQKSGYSLLFRDEAMGKGASGKTAIIPGDPDNSEFIRRLTSHDPDDRMPYHEEPLSEEEINLFYRWIDQGAAWGDHWAYKPVRPVPIPQVKAPFWGLMPSAHASWVRNDVDRYIAEKQIEQNLEPSPEADRKTLLRRLSLDLTGLPPSPQMTAQFLRDTRPDAYERMVDTLLASPHYGERWTALWMDLARYADTKGYERDDSRNIWRYRDWLIQSFNQDKPYNQFIIEQFAGDLLPNASDEQLIATAFHRNTMTNDEGGTDNEEFRTAAVIDRINTTWETVMGTTFACVQCHSHPYDPFRHTDYYRFMAFLNNTRDEDSYAEYPLLHEFTGNDAATYQKLQEWMTSHIHPDTAASIAYFLRTRQPAINSLTADNFVNSELSDTKWLVMRKSSSARLQHIDLTGKTQLLIRYDSKRQDGILVVMTDSIHGKEIARLKVPASTGGFKHVEVSIKPTSGIHDVYIQYASPSLTNPDENGIRFDWFYFTNPFPGKGSAGYDSAYAWHQQLLDAKEVITTPILVQNPSDMHRPTRVFTKGSWLVPGDEVMPGVPAVMNEFPSNAPRNRYGLALWITSKDNPLTARTFVNRIWEQIFGTGLAETLEDLGTQGIPPTHRELLDHLSWNFMHEYQWSVKKLLREIVLSATYRQDAKMDQEKWATDPSNRWLARGPRVRLTAEQIRDQALAVSGLLSKKLYGRSVMPYQPEGIWLSPYNGRKWVKSDGEDQYRRAIYTFWKRTAPYPSMISFDGSAREVCLSRRIRTNTPLQALTTLNDPVFLEAARYWVYRLQEQFPNQPEKLIEKAFTEATGEMPGMKKRVMLEKLYRESLSTFQKNPDKACEIIGVQDEHNHPSTAALVIVGSAILNLDEVLNKN